MSLRNPPAGPAPAVTPPPAGGPPTGFAAVATPAARRRKSRWKLWLALVLLLLLAGGGGAAWAFVKKREKPVLVQTEKIARRNLTELIVATGRIQAVTRVVINPEVSGEIVELPVRDGQAVRRGDLLVRIRPDPYIASRSSAQAGLQTALAGIALARAQLSKAQADFDRLKPLFEQQIASDADFIAARTALEVARAQLESSEHQADQARAALARAEEDLAKTTILAPIDGTVVGLKSERGERVVGTAMMAGTEIMTIADLNEMEARVDVGEVDIPLVQVGQKARLEVDSFRDRKFAGFVTEIANAAKTQGLGTQAEATKFEVRIRVQDKERFRPGMSVTAEIETRHRTNALAVPIQSVTTRLPTNAVAGGPPAATKAPPRADEADGLIEERRRPRDVQRPVEVVFLVADGRAVMRRVTRGISDDDYTEITEGVAEGEEVVSGGFRAINRELEDGKPVKREEGRKEDAGGWWRKK